MERRAQARVSLDVSKRFWQPQREGFARCKLRAAAIISAHRSQNPHRSGKAKQDVCQEQVVEALKPLEGRCSQRPDARQKIILVGIGETAGDASNSPPDKAVVSFGLRSS